MLKTYTADHLDAQPHSAVLPPLWRDYGGLRWCTGPLRTVKVFEDNSLVKQLLAQPGDGHVLLIDGGGSLRCALIGGDLAALAQRNGWAGLIVYGCIRDVVELAEVPLLIKALASHPRKSEKGLHGGAIDIALEIGGVRVAPGMWLLADPDGIVVAAERPT